MICRLHIRAAAAVLGAGLTLFSLSAGPAPQTANSVDFERDIQPILKASCYGCHSKAQASGQLRLDSKSAAMKGGISGPVIQPGRASESRLVHRLLGLGGEKKMPLGGKPLSEEQIALIRKWIDAGAPWPARAAGEDDGPAKHWAYVKPVRPKVPEVRNKAWVRNPIDNFVLARLEKEGLSPSPEASRETLIRRLSLDLTGLPPSVAEVDQFLADKDPNAYEKLVDRLLASPHYGERWARPWLDLARYADTNGYEKDRRRSIWKYRDWVIQAFNKDMPFDQFTIEQIAGDMLPNPTTDQLIATGFHRNTMFNEEGGVDKEEAHWENLVDRVNTTGTIWLGTTLGCAQCHNHKFDPFSIKDYYRLMAIFNNTRRDVRSYGDTSTKFVEPELELPTPEQARKREQIRSEISALEQALKTMTPELASEKAQWERGVVEAAADWAALKPAKAVSSGGSTLAVQKDSSILASGQNPETDDYIVEAKIPQRGITALRLEALPDPSLPRGGPGRDPYGNFFLSRVDVELLSSAGAKKLRIRKVLADDGRLNDKKFQQLWSVDASRDEKRLPRQMVLLLDAPAGSPGDTVRVTLHQTSEFGGQGLGRFRLSVTSSPEPERIVGVSAKLRSVLETPAARRTEKQEKDLIDYFLSVAKSLEPKRERLTALRKELDDLGIVTTLVMGEAPTSQPPSAVIRLRGSFTSPGETVYAGVPESLHPLGKGDSPNRLGLARWLVSKENPLVARVTVNRIWEQYFGRGIVETSEDFGTQGARPSHPELLDWLATEFVENGWSFKKLHRLIVTSATYRQSSAATPELLEKDPYNRLLARGARFRVEAEMIRDIALAASGLLSRKIGGPSVFPYQPEGIWDIPYNDDKWEESKGEDRYRRGIYTFIRRTSPYPSMLTFDAPSREVCVVRRVRTNTPLQALTALNDPAFFEAAQAMARRVLSEKEAGADDSSRAIYAFRLCTSRRPTQEELNQLLAGLRKERDYFARHEDEAERLVGQQPVGSALPQAQKVELAAWTMLSNVLLNLDETLSKE